LPLNFLREVEGNLLKAFMSLGIWGNLGEFGKPILNEREYKQTTVSQIQGFAARRIGTVV
jgi:hypothetical protein